MQTFLPFPEFARSVRVLDYRRLGKQRVEAFQILNALFDTSHGWRHHPAVKMWRGYEVALAVYLNACIDEWELRGYRNTMERMLDGLTDQRDVDVPPWLGDPAFHRSHQSNLLRKDEAHYRPHFPRVPSNLPYIWPIEDSMTTKPVFQQLAPTPERVL